MAADYTKWLGPDWKQELADFERKNKVATFVANHTGGFLDIHTLFAANNGNLAFVAASSFKGVPVIGKSIQAGDGIFVDREASRESRGKSVDTIAERQKAIQASQTNRKPLLIFPEGICTVGGICKFKRGAF